MQCFPASMDNPPCFLQILTTPPAYDFSKNSTPLLIIGGFTVCNASKYTVKSYRKCFFGINMLSYNSGCLMRVKNLFCPEMQH